MLANVEVYYFESVELRVMSLLLQDRVSYYVGNTVYNLHFIFCPMKNV